MHQSVIQYFLVNLSYKVHFSMGGATGVWGKMSSNFRKIVRISNIGAQKLLRSPLARFQYRGNSNIDYCEGLLCLQNSTVVYSLCHVLIFLLFRSSSRSCMFSNSQIVRMNLRQVILVSE